MRPAVEGMVVLQEVGVVMVVDRGEGGGGERDVDVR